MKNHRMHVVNKEEVKRADIIVGIPSYNEADNIDFVVEQVDQGLKKFFSNNKAVVVNVDNNSQDGTRDVFLQTKTSSAKIYISTPKGVRGKGNNFFNLFKITKKLKAKYIVVVDADLKSIKPSWVRDFIKPLQESRDYITPVYSRHEYDGSITNSICYPIIYGVLGHNIRQPIGGDFAFKNNVAEHWLKSEWLKSTYHYGIDIFMTMQAIFGGFKIGQVNLGAKIHKPSAPKLGPMFSQVVATLFYNLSHNKDKWLKIRKIKEIPVYGKAGTRRVQGLPVDYKGTKETAKYLYSINKQLYDGYLKRSTVNDLQDAFNKDVIHISIKLWLKILYDAYYSSSISRNRQSIVEALKPLFFARFISFYKKTLELSHEDSEQAIKNQAMYFWRYRHYLLAKYK